MTILIIILTVVVSYLGFNSEKTLQNCMNHPYSVMHRNEYFRMVTSGFVHRDWWHLIFNMISLYYFGSVVEMILKQKYGSSGTYIYGAAYVVAIILSDIPFTIEKRNQNAYYSYGASGATSAMMLASVILSPMSKICLYFVLCLPAVAFALLFVGYSWYGSRSRNEDGVNHSAHFYGALLGIFFITIAVPGAFGNFLTEITNFRF